MLHRMVLTARSRLDTGPRALTGALGGFVAGRMQASIDGGLTGGLVLDTGHLFKLLEGESAALCAAHERAGRDAYLDTIQVLEFIPILHRAHQTWAVASVSADLSDPALLDAVADKRAGPFAVSQHVRRVLATGIIAETPPLCVAA